MMPCEPPEATDGRATSAQQMPDSGAGLTQSVFSGRLHPLTLGFAAYGSLRRFILPAIPLVFFSNRLISAVVLSLMIGLALLRAVVRYITFSYRIEQGELIIRQGIFERTERHVPLERVQEVRIEQGVLHRIFGVVDAMIETAGGQGPEASLSVVSRGEAERLRRAVFDRQPAIESEETKPAARRQLIARLTLRDLVLAGITSNHLVSALLVTGAIWAFLDDILPEEFYERMATAVYGEGRRLFERGAQAVLIVAAAGALAVLLISMLLSIVGSIVLFYRFTLSRVGEDLHRSYGLLTNRSSSLPRRRIQVLQIKEGMLRRLFGLATLRADTAGGRSQDQQESKGGRDLLLPIFRTTRITALLPVIFADLEQPLTWSRVSRLAVLKGTAKGGIFLAVLALGLFAIYGRLLALAPLLLLPLAYLISAARFRHLGYWVGERYFESRRGWLSRSTHIVPLRNAQVIAVRRSPLDRRLGLATLVVNTAGQSYTGPSPQINNLPLEEAEKLARIIAHRAALMRYRL